jgi:hypothetical protein
MREHEINKLNNFIAGWYLEDTIICDKIISFHKNSPDKRNGTTGAGYLPNQKISTDVTLQHDPELTKEYLTNHLQLCVYSYIEKYPWCNAYTPWLVKEGVNIQHYMPNQGFLMWHSERTSCKSPHNNRNLVFMTYLNDVTDGGETEWYHQKIKVRPQKGLTIVWNSDWTFTHRGLVSSEDKYIVTGWFNFLKES